MAPDGINVDATGTYFAGSLFPDGNFYGTSAAVPNAGAVAALIRAAIRSMTASQLVDVLTKGATQLGSVAPDGTFGFGRVDAIGALNVAISVAGNPAPPTNSTPTPPPTHAVRSARLPAGGGGGGGAINGWTLAALLLVLILRRRLICQRSNGSAIITAAITRGLSMRAIPFLLATITGDQQPRSPRPPSTKPKLTPH